LENFSPQEINVLIGANGSGKSNLIFFFNLLSWMVKSPERFQEKIGEWGNASGLLHLGSRVTRDLVGYLNIETEAGENEYRFRLHAGGGDRLFFAEEKIRHTNPNMGPGKANWLEIGAGGPESKLLEKRSDHRTIRVIGDLLRQIQVYQFHDTSLESFIRKSWQRLDGSYLKGHGGNLGSFLLNLQENHSAHYVRIVQYIREIVPDFDNFVFSEGNTIPLRWAEKNTEYIFSADQASDGMLRFFALVSLLAQPSEKLPPVMFIDEPELGLHPQAIVFLAGLIRKAATHSQIFVSTQSPELVSQFKPRHIVVVEKKKGISTYHVQEEAKLKTWLDEFTMGEIWSHNLIGGRP
jgi:predicted ATPase